MGIFEDALARKEQQEAEAQKEKEKRGSGFTQDFEEIKGKMGLVTEEERAFRIIGNPYLVRDKATDNKFLFHSRIVDDNGGYAHVNWKWSDTEAGPVLDDTWILKKLYDKVFEQKWVNYTEEEKLANPGKKGYYSHLHKDFPSFKRIENNKREDDKYPPKFYPGKRILMNVIDRHDTWCKDNNHSKILFAKVNKFKDKSSDNMIEMVNDPGVPMMIFTAIMENVVKYRKNWDVDIIIRKNTEKNNMYTVKDATEQKISDDIKKIVNSDPMTEEEKSYQLYDFDKLYPVTSYNKILKRFKGLFNQVDADFGTNFKGELEKLAEKESQEFEEKRKEQEATNTPVVKSETVKEFEQAVEKDEVKEERKSRSSEQSKEDKLKAIFPLYSKMSKEDEKDLLDAVVDVINGVVTYKPNIALASCNKDKAKCSIMLPNTVLVCPNCGADYN